MLAELHRLLWPDLFVIGGGVTENWASFGHLLTSPAEIAVARYGNDAPARARAWSRAVREAARLADEFAQWLAQGGRQGVLPL